MSRDNLSSNDDISDENDSDIGSETSASSDDSSSSSEQGSIQNKKRKRREHEDDLYLHSVPSTLLQRHETS